METIKKCYKKELNVFQSQRQSKHHLWNISESSAEILYMLISLKSPTQILEIGTSNGYSTFWLSLAAEKFNAFVTSLEVDENRYKMAVENLKDRSNIELIHSKAENIIPILDKKFDFVFIDAGKINYIDYILLLITKLNDNAVIVADNVVSHAHTVAEYLKFVKSNSMFESITLPIDTGLEISIYHKTGDENV